MSFGTFIKDGNPDSLGRTLLCAAYNDSLIIRKEIMDSWVEWYTTTRKVTTATATSETPGFRVYPNPFNNKCSVESFVPLSDVIIYDLSGKVVMALKTKRFVTNINTENLKKGAYIIKIVTAGKHKSGLIIKE